MGIVDDARAYALKMHGGQQYGGRPYSVHLDDVAGIVRGAGADPVAVAVAYLHDVVEDTSATVEDVADAFGADVADAVALLTDVPGVNRRERKERTYARLTTSKNRLAKLVKLADRLANVRASVAGGRSTEGLLKMYRKEHGAFRSATYGADATIEGELDELLGYDRDLGEVMMHSLTLGHGVV